MVVKCTRLDGDRLVWTVDGRPVPSMEVDFVLGVHMFTDMSYAALADGSAEVTL